MPIHSIMHPPHTPPTHTGETQRNMWGNAKQWLHERGEEVVKGAALVAEKAEEVGGWVG